MRTGTDPGIRIPSMPEPTIRDDRFLMIGLAITAVWVAIGAISLYTPDMVAGTEHEHLPLAAMTAWVWGVLATGFVGMSGAMGRGVTDARWRGLALTITGIWTVVAIASIYSPMLVAGTDPTEIPLASMIAPFAGMIGTAFACLFVAGASRN
jgi:hypothetical protein